MFRLLLLAGLGLFPRAGQAEDPHAGAQRPAILVLPIDLDKKDPEQVALEALLRQAVVDGAVEHGAYRVIDRDELAKVSDEQARQSASLATDERQKVELGRIAGAQKLVAGRLQRIDRSFILGLRMLDLSTGEIVATARELCECDSKQLLVSATRLSHRLLDSTTHRDAAPPHEAPKGSGEAGESVSSTPEMARPGPTIFVQAPGHGRSLAPRCPSGTTFVAGGEVILARDDRTQEKLLSAEPYCIDRFEYPNRQGVKPIASLTYDEAETRCRSEGKRLCSSSEWTLACKGDGLDTYPYGEAFDEGRCWTGQPFGAGASASGAHPRCRGDRAVHDLTGNVWEWVSRSGDDRSATVFGGDWSGEPLRVRCDTSRRVPTTRKEPNVGFRCCLNASTN